MIADADSDILPISIQTDEMLAIEVPLQSTSVETTKTVNFKFNKVFGMKTTQNEVFREVKEVVQVITAKKAGLIQNFYVSTTFFFAVPFVSI